MKPKYLCALLLLACRGLAAAQQPTAAEMSKKETVASALLRGIQFQEYELRSAARAMPEEKYSYRPAEGKFKNEKPEFGPAEVRTFAEQVKHVACSNFGFAAEFDGQKPPGGCDKGGPSAARTKKELLIYLRDSFAAIRKSVGAITAQNMYEPIEGPYAGPNTRLGLATVVIWHCADHYGQMTLYLRLNNIVPPASRTNPPELKDSY
jgi:hypothetical protein